MQSFFDTVLSPFNTPIAGAQVFVYKADGTLATIYDSNVPLSTTVLSSNGTPYYISEDLLSPISNPIVTGADGKYLFFAANGVYSVIIVAANYDSKTLSVTLNDPSISPFIEAVDIQEFTSVGTSTWTKPVGARYVEVLLFGGGGGGGSGRRRGSGSLAAGSGSGGAPAARLELKLPAAALNATETVIVGAGGTGGAAQTADATNGNAGVDGGSSAFKTFYASGGRGGVGGNDSSMASTLPRNSVEGTTTQGSLNSPNGASGSFTSPSGGGSVGVLMPGGGGAGGGYQFGLTGDRTGSPGGKGGVAFDDPPNSVSAGGGGAGGTPGNNGSAGADAPAGYWVGGSGGGGGGSNTTQAGSGGKGGYPGAGGGSGAASSGTFNSGAGGDGGDGFVRVVTYI